MTPRVGGRDTRLVTVLAAWFLVAAALFVRIAPFVEDVFRSDGIHAWRCPDVYYHLHRIEVGARAFPAFPELDRWRDYPDGAYSLWTPLFEWVPAAVAAVTGRPPILVGVVWPAVLGALAVLPLLAVLRRLHGGAAWLGAAIFVVLPGAVSFSLLSRADHHVGEVVVQLGVYALALRDFQTLEGNRAPTAAQAVGLGTVMGLSLWMWRGSLIWLAVPAFVALCCIARSRDESWRKIATRHFVVAFVAAAAVAAPYGLLGALRGRELASAYFLSLFQPAVLLIAALLLPLVERWTRRGPSPDRFDPRTLIAVTAVGALSIFALSGLRSGVAFLTRQGDVWAATIEESQPLWAGGRPLLFVIEQLGFVPVLLPLVLVAQLAWVLRARERFPTALFAFAATACATALVFLQVRFVYYAAPIVAAVPGAVWWAVGPRRQGLRVGALALVLGLMWPTHRFWRDAIDGDATTRMSVASFEPWLRAFLAELLTSTPSAGDVRHPGIRPAYCVLAPWSIGNFIQLIAERPVLASSGGPHETPSGYAETFAFQHRLESEAEAIALMQRRGCRYAITEHVPAEVEPEKSATLFARRLHDHDGSDEGALAGAGRFRWRFESREPGKVHAKYKVFELVEGAVLSLPAGEAARAATRVQGASRSIVYARRFGPASDGRLEARLSQPGDYAIVAADGRPLGSVRVSEEAVGEGRRLALAADEPPPPSVSP